LLLQVLPLFFEISPTLTQSKMMSRSWSVRDHGSFLLANGPICAETWLATNPAQLDAAPANLIGGAKIDDTTDFLLFSLIAAPSQRLFEFSLANSLLAQQIRILSWQCRNFRSLALREDFEQLTSLV
jgi:hypothetical protein